MRCARRTIAYRAGMRESAFACVAVDGDLAINGSASGRRRRVTDRPADEHRSSAMLIGMPTRRRCAMHGGARCAAWSLAIVSGAGMSHGRARLERAMLSIGRCQRLGTPALRGTRTACTSSTCISDSAIEHRRAGCITCVAPAGAGKPCGFRLLRGGARTASLLHIECNRPLVNLGVRPPQTFK